MAKTWATKCCPGTYKNNYQLCCGIKGVKGKKRPVRQNDNIPSENRHADKNEDTILFERLRKLRRQIADANNWPAYIVLSDKSLHALATERPTTLYDFGNIFGVGEHKRDIYGEQFIAIIKEYSKKEVIHTHKSIVSPQEVIQVSSYMDRQKQIYSQAYVPWTEEDDNSLRRLYAEGVSITELMEILNRDSGDIRSRLKEMGYTED